MLSKSVNAEIEPMLDCYKVLTDFNVTTQQRMLAWIITRLEEDDEESETEG